MKRKIISSWDDGHPKDLKLFELLRNSPKVKAIFYTPIMNFERNFLAPNDIAKISQLYEIGGHTYTHQNLTRLPLEAAEAEITTGKERLEEIIGKEITSFCYPKGKYNNKIMELVSQAGFTEARTVDVLSTEFPEDPLRTKTTIHVHPKRKEYKGKDWLELAYKYFDKVMEEGGYFHLWGHSWEVEKYDQWNKLRQFIKYMDSKL